MTTATDINLAPTTTVTMLDATDDWNGVPMIRLSCSHGSIDLTAQGKRPTAPSRDAWVSGAFYDTDDFEDVIELIPALITAARADVYDYQTGKHIGYVGWSQFARYIQEAEGDAGVVDGDDYGFPGVTIYMQG